jgi:hypothetical protein
MKADPYPGLILPKRVPLCETVAAADWTVLARLGRHLGHPTATGAQSPIAPTCSFNHAWMKGSISPSSTAPVLPISTSVRMSLTIW